MNIGHSTNVNVHLVK